MKATINIPKGWRRLPSRTRLMRGDRHFCFEGGPEWFQTEMSEGDRVQRGSFFIYIRKIKNKDIK